MKLDIYSSLSSQRALPHRQSACAGRFLRFFCRHGDKAPLFCFVRRMISALSPGGSFLRRASPLPYTSATPRRAPLPLRPLRTVPCGEAGAASASPFPWRAFSPMYAAPRTSPLHRPSGLRLAGRQERPPAIPLPWRRAFSPMPAPRLLSMHAAPRTRSSLRPLRAVPYRAAGSASRNPVSAARLRSPLRPFGLRLTGRQERPPQSRFHGAPFLPCTPRLPSPLRPFGLRLTGRQERPPQARFHGALPLPCMPRRAPLPLHCPFGLCLTGRQERPPAIPFLRRAFSPCTSAPRTRSPMRPLRTVPCGEAGAASRKPASMARFPSLARPRRAPVLPCTAPSGCALRSGRSGLPQARFHGMPPLPCMPRRAPLPLRPLRAVPYRAAGAASASPLLWRAFPPCMPRRAPDPAGGPPAPAALPHRFGNFYSKPHQREKAGCACIVYKSSRFGYSRLHENSERFFTNSKNLVSLYLGSRPALHGSAERPARRRTYRQRPTRRPHRERREKRAAFYCTAVFLCQRGNYAS